jgi:hypothetical protein
MSEKLVKDVEVEVPDGYEIDEEASTFRRIKFKKKAECSDWEELGRISGYYIESDSSIDDTGPIEASGQNRNIFATVRQAEAAIAFAQLSQLMKHVNGEWKPDWTIDDAKYIIYRTGNDITKGRSFQAYYFLSFPTYDSCDKFFKNHEQLIKQAMPLL